MLTDEQKAKITGLVRAILSAGLPPQVRSSMINAFYDWPEPDPEPEDYGETDGYQAREILEAELDADLDRAMHCGVCKEDKPRGFMVPDECWAFYNPENHRFLCLPCYRKLVKEKDAGAFERLRGKPALISHTDAGLIPISDAGIDRMETMTGEEIREFLSYVRRSGHWRWLKARKKPTKIRVHP